MTALPDCRRIESVAVIVPAANEELEIDGCLQAVGAARRHLLASTATGVRPIDVRIVVVLDACTDDTAAIAARPGVELLAVEARSVGVARAAGAERVLRTTGESSRLWLANTDADSAVPVDWLRTMVELADAGADMVLGTVVPDAALPPAVLAAWHARHRLSEDHTYVHGANLGLRGDVYSRLGGWPAVPSDEDVALAERASAAGCVIARTAAIPVCTSSRLVGRAPNGFADYLRTLTASRALPADLGLRPVRRSPTTAGHDGRLIEASG